MSSPNLSTSTPTTGWEYTFLATNLTLASLDQINQYAKQGWRLVQVVHNDEFFQAILERPLPTVTG